MESPLLQEARLRRRSKYHTVGTLFLFSLELETEDGLVTRQYIGEYRVDEGQDGGRDDPSWDAYPYLDGPITDLNHQPVDETEELIAAAEAAMEKHYEDEKE